MTKNQDIEWAAAKLDSSAPWDIEAVPVWRQFNPDDESLQAAIVAVRAGEVRVTITGYWLAREPYPGCEGDVSYNLNWSGVDNDIPEWDCIGANIPDMEPDGTVRDPKTGAVVMTAEEVAAR